MPFNSRDMWVYLKAQDLATRALNSFSRSVRDAGASVRVAQLQADRAAEQSLLTQQRLLASAKAQEIQHINNQKAAVNYALAQGRLNGMAASDIHLLNQQKLSLEEERLTRLSELETINATALGHQRNVAHIENEIQAFRNMQSEVDRSSERLNRFRGVMGQISQTAQATGFALSAVGAIGVLGFANATKAAVEYDRQVRLTATQIDNFDGNLKQLGDIGIQVGNTIGVKFEDIQKALYDIFSSIDVSVPQAQTLLTNFAKAAVAGQTDIESVSRGTIGIMNAFQLPVSDINHLLDVQFKLVEKGVGTYDEWIGRIGQVSPSAIRAGQSVEMMAAALEASTRFGIPAAQSAASVARAFDAFSNPAAIEALKKIGVNVTDAQGKFRPFIDVMRDFKAELDKSFGGNEAAKVAQIVDVFKGAGGTIQARRFLQNLLLVNGNLDLMQSLLQNTTDSAGALQGAYDQMSGSVSAQTQVMKNKLQDMKITIGTALLPTFMQLVNFAQRVIDKFNNLSPATQNIIIKVGLLATVLAGIGGPLLIMIGFLASAIGAIAAAGSTIGIVIGIIAGFVAAIVGLGILLKEMYDHSQPLRFLFQDIGQALSFFWKVLKDGAHDAKAIFDSELRPALENLWNTINNRIIVALREFWDEFWNKHKNDLIELKNWLLSIMRDGFQAISTVIKTVLIPAIQQASDYWEKHRTGIMQVVGWIETLGKWILKIIGAAFLGGLIATIIVVIGFIAGFILFIKQTIDAISTLVHWGAIFIGWLKDAWHWVQNASESVKTFANMVLLKLLGVLQDVQTWPGKILAAFGGLGSLLLQKGKDLVQGLINGIISMGSRVAEALVNLLPGPVKKLANFLGLASPSKLFYKYGRWTIQGFINGVNSMTPDLTSAIGNVGSMTSNITPSVTNNYLPAANNGGARAQVNVYVTTQEISPQYHAAQLGNYLAARI